MGVGWVRATPLRVIASDTWWWWRRSNVRTRRGEGVPPWVHVRTSF